MLFKENKVYYIEESLFKTGRLIRQTERLIREREACYRKGRFTRQEKAY